MSDINPEAWIRGFRNANGRLLKQAARSATTQEKHDVNSMFPKPAASGFAIREGRMAVNPAQAQRILDEMNFAGQRKIAASHVAVLAEQMRAGVWTEGSQIAFASRPSGRMQLINGQHRLHAVIESGTTQEFQVIAVAATDDASVAQLYYRFDTMQRRRSNETILSTLGIAEEHDIQRGVARAAYEAGAIIACGMQRVAAVMMPVALRTPDGRLKAIRPFWPQVKLYNDLIAGGERAVTTRLINGCVVAVAILTLRDQPESAKPFWKGVAQNSGLLKGDPRRALVMVLIQKEMLKGDIGIFASVNAWNAWATNRKINYVMPNRGAMPKLHGVKIP